MPCNHLYSKVISPDPNLRIDEVGVPVFIAMTLTFPEVVNSFNIERMKSLIMTGADKHPGANYVVDRVTATKRLLKYVFFSLRQLGPRFSHGLPTSRYYYLSMSQRVRAPEVYSIVVVPLNLRIFIIFRFTNSIA